MIVLEVVLLCICEARQDHGLGKIGCYRPFLNKIFVCFLFCLQH